MSAKIIKIKRWSPAHRAGVRPGEVLTEIDGHPVNDVLDYQFYAYGERIALTLRDKELKRARRVIVTKAEGQDAGITFETYLMDKARRCSNRCVFCFIDQMPAGMRESLYFKDDDARLSFLMGNYISLTNLSEDDARRILSMRISPINISVHTTNPELRERMLGNPKAGSCLSLLDVFCEAGLTLNCQIVVCPGWNDGEELDKTLSRLISLSPAVNSISVVPVGLTRHREGLAPLKAVDRDGAVRIIEIASGWGERCLKDLGRRTVYIADELYLTAGEEIPEYGYYDDYPQLENGVGMLSLFKREFSEALSQGGLPDTIRPFTIVTGRAAAPFLASLVDELQIKCDNIQYNICTVENRFFGSGVTVAGLLTGTDIIAALREQPVFERVLLPESVLRHGEDVFLDDMSLPELARLLDREVRAVPVTGEALLKEILCQNR